VLKNLLIKRCITDYKIHKRPIYLADDSRNKYTRMKDKEWVIDYNSDFIIQGLSKLLLRYYKNHPEFGILLSTFENKSKGIIP
jgi:hypothetical protein